MYSCMTLNATSLQVSMCVVCILLQSTTLPHVHCCVQLRTWQQDDYNVKAWFSIRRGLQHIFAEATALQSCSVLESLNSPPKTSSDFRGWSNISLQISKRR